MRVADFNFELPDELIARYPTADRTASRLLSLEAGKIQHGHFLDIINKLMPGDCLIFNNTRVIPARLFGEKATGGQLEILMERLLTPQRMLAHVRASKAPKLGSTLYVGTDRGVRIAATMVARHGALFELEIISSPWLDVLEHYGHMPLPPYIDRPDDSSDQTRYQTVYNAIPGAVAAPTAGLHFDHALLEALTAKGVQQAFVTLHVGAGTFQPVRVAEINDHVMHSEYIDVPAATVQAIADTKARGGRVIAVGTTSVRALESAAQHTWPQPLAPYHGDTQIFIYPGYRFRVIDALITNFHLPESTLLMLVSALGGYQAIQTAYQAAIAERYRFFSYGDAMWITNTTPPADATGA